MLSSIVEQHMVGPIAFVGFVLLLCALIILWMIRGEGKTHLVTAGKNYFLEPLDWEILQWCHKNDPKNINDCYSHFADTCQRRRSLVQQSIEVLKKHGLLVASCKDVHLTMKGVSALEARAREEFQQQTALRASI